MHIAIISGSHRQNAQSLRTANYIANRLVKTEDSVTADVIALTGNPLPLWDESMWQAGSALQQQWQPYAKRLQAADALVVISPEWAGMVPAGLKNFFLYCTPQDVGHKPAMIVGVSSGINGAYPVAELRASGYKNTKICYIPDHIIVRTAEKMLIGDTPADTHDESLRDRIDFTLHVLLGYAKALKPLRDSGLVFDKKYAFGM